MIINQWQPVNHYFPNVVTVLYYDITGPTAEDLRAQMNAKRLVDSHGRRCDALTEWFFHWNWPGCGTSSCQLEKAIVSYTIEVKFPRWIQPVSTAPKVVAEWENYICALAQHEKGHVDIILKNHQLVADAIKSARWNTANSAAHAALARLQQLSDQYDAITDHGATQGARFL
jgi:predicted secreted Zn-dependent protease